MIRFNTSNSRVFEREEIWFNHHDPPVVGSGNSIFYQSLVEPSTPVQNLKVFRTSLVQLSEDEDEIFGKINRTFRSHIRRAEKQGIVFEASSGSNRSVLSAYLDTQRIWSSKKGRSPITRLRAEAILSNENSFLTFACHDGVPIVYHLYVGDESRVRMVTSHNAENVDSKLIGLANKFLHFQGMMHYKKLGIGIYDFGGVDEVGTPGIAKFKLSFGGSDEFSFNFSIERALYKTVKTVSRMFRRRKKF
jgi:hypothetical protein